jgi:hypothetical protein
MGESKINLVCGGDREVPRVALVGGGGGGRRPRTRTQIAVWWRRRAVGAWGYGCK